MPVRPTYPGVYIEEIPSGVRPVAAVATSTAAFVGTFRKGLLDEALKASYSPEVIAALKDKGPDGLVGFLSDDDQLTLLDNLTEVMESSAPAQCGYKDGHPDE